MDGGHLNAQFAAGPEHEGNLARLARNLVKHLLFDRHKGSAMFNGCIFNMDANDLPPPAVDLVHGFPFNNQGSAP
jgi:hypothetical protein